MNSCLLCKHYESWRETESWEMPHIYWYEFRCNKRPGIDRLKQFPFKRTQCPAFDPKNQPTQKP